MEDITLAVRTRLVGPPGTRPLARGLTRWRAPARNRMLSPSSRIRSTTPTTTCCFRCGWRPRRT
eukprot:1306954-Prymnesium_polylepis.1